MTTASHQPKNILVRMPNWLGDLVMATPILTDLRNHWPEAKINVMCQGALGTVLQRDPHIDHVLSIKKPKNWLWGQDQREIIQTLRQGQYDLGLLLTNSFSSAFVFWRSGIKPTFGFDTHMRRFFLDQPVPQPAAKKDQHLVVTYKMLLEPLGIPLSNTPPALYLTPEEKSHIQQELKKKAIASTHQLIGINPGAAYGSAKCWLPDRFRELTEKLLQNPNTRILYFGDKAGASLVNEICAGLPDRVINLAAQTTIRELMAYIQACHLFLTNDSGPMHMASALGTPLVALFGSTSDRYTGPYRGGKVIHKHVPCSPCYRRTCPIDFRCMTQIGVDEVYQTLQAYL